MEAYPEGTIPIQSELERTPMHAVAIGGDPEKMRLIYKDFLDRKQKELRASAK